MPHVQIYAVIFVAMKTDQANMGYSGSSLIGLTPQPEIVPNKGFSPAAPKSPVDVTEQSRQVAGEKASMSLAPQIRPWVRFWAKVIDW